MLSSDIDLQHKQIIDAVLIGAPGVKQGKLFGYTAYKIHGRAFAVWCGGGLAIKLPGETVQSLIAAGRAGPFEPVEGTLWREWALLSLTSPADASAAAPLLDEAMAFTVSS
jgi:hypothetical protein